MVAAAAHYLDLHSLDRRGDQRVLLDVQVTVSFDGGITRWTETDARLVDLSGRGMFVRCDRMPTDGHRILVGLLHPERGLCAAAGRAVRFDGGGGFGVRFERMNSAFADLARRLKKASPEQRRALMTGATDTRIWITPR